MNIFYLSNNVTECAEFHNNRHVVKMILEYTQLLSTAHRVLDGKEVVEKTAKGRNVTRWVLPEPLDNILYKATHINHPSAIWVRKSADNYLWLHQMLLALIKEYTYRYEKHHKCEAISSYLNSVPINIGKEVFTEPTPAMPDECKIIGDSIRSYRNYYVMKKQHIAAWKNRPIPEWFNS